MSVIALTSIAGAPGVTTLAAAWAMLSPRPTLILEADPTGGSPLLAMLWEGRLSEPTSIANLAGRPSANLAEHIWEQALPIPEATDAWVVPTIGSPAQSAPLMAMWEPMARATQEISHAGGVDVIVDAGRAGLPGGPWPLIETADVVLTLTDTTLPALTVSTVGALVMRNELARSGSPDRHVMVLMSDRARKISTARPWGRSEIAGMLDPVPVISTLPRDEQGALNPTSRAGRTYAASVRSLIDAARDRCAALAPEVPTS